VTTFKDILVHVEDEAHDRGRIDAAVALAKQHQAHLVGLHLILDATIPAALLGMIPSEALAAQRDAARQEMEAACAAFRARLDRAGVAGESRVVQTPEEAAAATISLHARHADLVILGQPDPSEPGGEALSAQVTLGAGRPVLVVPYVGPQERLGQRVLIAWNAAREAARAVHDALPILKRAKAAFALEIDPESEPERGRPPAGVSLALHLARHGVKVETTQTVAGEISVADAILGTAADLGIDLIVMGAYGHSRLRELILGGVSRQLLRTMTVPVFLSH